MRPEKYLNSREQLYIPSDKKERQSANSESSASRLAKLLRARREDLRAWTEWLMDPSFRSKTHN
jgi:hypothetical protein